MISSKSTSAFTLIEVIAAVILVSVVAMLGIQHVRTAGESGQARGCELNRRTLQLEVERYELLNRSLPSRDLRELKSADYWNGDLPTCPVTGQAMTIDRDGNVVCPTHR
ncbi:hypothetical protein Pla22_15620 [Rubripirellula amarantea]|uniref:Type II secretion system protein G n=1 Tax=Rubripirellula amarantea TaxID=2527999 RepID=A0A5C5WTP7_9BACT|nr:prepilin-type N-terminal cleavage/methylation domain-containing protein [Rubripirellula amarantea]TWT53928.1 hypothetical protein Pla22_15620 [Rubripirellula amarantea]